jgi:hypothetical protein
MKINKYVLNILFFFIVLFVSDRSISWVLDRMLSKSGFRYVRMYEGKDDADIAVMGNSRGVNTFFTPYLEKKTGKKITNLAYNGMKMELAAVLVNDYVDLYQPDLILFEAGMLFNKPSDTTLLRNFKLYLDDSERIAEKLKSDALKEFYALKLFKLYKFNSDFFYRNLSYFGENDKSWINNYKMSSKLLKKTEEMKIIELDVNEKSVEIFNDLVKDLRKKNIKVKLLLGPYLPLYKSKISNFDSLVNQISNDTDALFYDYSSTLTDSNFFGDRVHTNKEGAMNMADKMLMEGVLE